ncbi:hypothetical protein A4G99_17970 [Haladaptatus sp. R4]|nr:hypothetical protein A4G99_17970 [Haladaptatus sp. R4]
MVSRVEKSDRSNVDIHRPLPGLVISTRSVVERVRAAGFRFDGDTTPSFIARTLTISSRLPEIPFWSVLVWPRTSISLDSGRRTLLPTSIRRPHHRE